ncbi:MAG: hypothetical protein AAGG44_15710, partial [Planctomycetota bacterium]
FGEELKIEVHNSFRQMSNTLTYTVPSPDRLDSDGDGLLDAWERGSVDGLDLVALGANPYRKDVYVEVDRMVVPGRIWSDFSEQDYPSKTTFVESVRSYAAAPIINPDLSVGISLHIDYGQANFENAPKSEGGTEIPWKRFLGYKRSLEFRRKHPEYYDAEELRRNPDFFPPNRSKVFRYCIFGDQQWSSRSTGGGNFQSTFFLTLGVCRMNAVNPNYQTGVFLHELGHMFGLSHQGSGRGYNYKPNFNSLMNYKFVFQGRDINGKLGSGIRNDNSGEQIYSYSEGMRATLDEGHLNEVVGVANHYPHDWNGDGVIDSKPIKAIIAKHRRTEDPRVLNDFADWSNLKFKQLADLKVISRAEPKRLTERRVLGAARVPADVDCGFMCEVDGVIQTGHWKVVGRVTSCKRGKVAFETNEFRVRGKLRTKAMPGHFAYRLPEGRQLDLQEGDPITILHDYASREKRVERNIHIASGTQLILATAHFDNSSVPRSADRAELLCQSLPDGQIQFYWSDPADDDVEQELKTAPQFPDPVCLECQAATKLVSIADAEKSFQSIELQGAEYLFRVLNSQQYREDGDEQAASDLSIGSNGDDDETDQPGVYYGGECLLLKASSEDRQ